MGAAQSTERSISFEKRRGNRRIKREVSEGEIYNGYTTNMKEKESTKKTTKTSTSSATKVIKKDTKKTKPAVVVATDNKSNTPMDWVTTTIDKQEAMLLLNFKSDNLSIPVYILRNLPRREGPVKYVYVHQEGIVLRIPYVEDNVLRTTKTQLTELVMKKESTHLENYRKEGGMELFEESFNLQEDMEKVAEKNSRLSKQKIIEGIVTDEIEGSVMMKHIKETLNTTVSKAELLEQQKDVNRMLVPTKKEESLQDFKIEREEFQFTKSVVNRIREEIQSSGAIEMKLRDIGIQDQEQSRYRETYDSILESMVRENMENRNIMTDILTPELADTVFSNARELLLNDREFLLLAEKTGAEPGTQQYEKLLKSLIDPEMDRLVSETIFERLKKQIATTKKFQKALASIVSNDQDQQRVFEAEKKLLIEMVDEIMESKETKDEIRHFSNIYSESKLDYDVGRLELATKPKALESKLVGEKLREATKKEKKEALEKSKQLKSTFVEGLQKAIKNDTEELKRSNISKQAPTKNQIKKWALELFFKDMTKSIDAKTKVMNSLSSVHSSQELDPSQKKLLEFLGSVMTSNDKSAMNDFRIKLAVAKSLYNFLLESVDKNAQLQGVSEKQQLTEGDQDSLKHSFPMLRSTLYADNLWEKMRNQLSLDLSRPVEPEEIVTHGTRQLMLLRARECYDKIFKLIYEVTILIGEPDVHVMKSILSHVEEKNQPLFTNAVIKRVCKAIVFGQRIMKVEAPYVLHKKMKEKTGDSNTSPKFRADLRDDQDAIFAVLMQLYNKT